MDLPNSKFTFINPISIFEFSKRLNIDPGLVIKHFFIKGKFTNLSTVLSKEDCEDFCKSNSFEFEIGKEEATDSDIFSDYLNFDSVEVCKKDPVVTIMGHVDHGKTTLLDKIRGSNITSKEFGGITQHIGSYQVTKDNKKITFLDTPGHQAFTKMRARGANVTDIVVLVVAADDGIKPQTIEAIGHALAAKTKIIVFINKVDKGTKQIGSIKSALMEHNLVLEEFGGDVLCVEGSALTGKGIDELLDAILLVSEVSDFVTTKSNPAIGFVLESSVEKGFGNSANILLSRGTLKVGDFLVMKSTFCKVKAILGDNGKEISSLEPSVPGKVFGFKSLPDSGDKFISFTNESKAKEMFKSLEKNNSKEIVLEPQDLKLSILVKADVGGSLEAIKEIVSSMGVPIVASGIGQVSESDLQLASISSALILNFNQKISGSILNRAKDMKIAIKNYRSVYEIEEELVNLIEQNRVIDWVEESLGQAKVVKLWYHSKVGTIAGCKVISGTISKNDKLKVIRDGEVLVSSTIKSFKTEAYEIKECSETQECGIVLNNWNDIKENDILEAYRLVEKK